MPKKYGITYRFLADIVGKKEATVRQYFSRKGWSIKEVKNVKDYLTINSI
jgi:hypothetical protein